MLMQAFLTAMRSTQGNTIIRFHKTDIVVADKDGVTLTSGGWKTTIYCHNWEFLYAGIKKHLGLSYMDRRAR